MAPCKRGGILARGEVGTAPSLVASFSKRSKISQVRCQPNWGQSHRCSPPIERAGGTRGSSGERLMDARWTHLTPLAGRILASRTTKPPPKQGFLGEPSVGFEPTTPSLPSGQITFRRGSCQFGIHGFLPACVPNLRERDLGAVRGISDPHGPILDPRAACQSREVGMVVVAPTGPAP